MPPTAAGARGRAADDRPVAAAPRPTQAAVRPRAIRNADLGAADRPRPAAGARRSGGRAERRRCHPRRRCRPPLGSPAGRRQLRLHRRRLRADALHRPQRCGTGGRRVRRRGQRAAAGAGGRRDDPRPGARRAARGKRDRKRSGSARSPPPTPRPARRRPSAGRARSTLLQVGPSRFAARGATLHVPRGLTRPAATDSAPATDTVSAADVDRPARSALRHCCRPASTW